MRPSAFLRPVLPCLLACASIVSGQGTYTVTSTADTDSAGTLRWAITQANANSGSTVTLADNLGTISLTNALPVITTAVTINGGAGNTISGAGQYRIFFVAAGSSDAVAFQNLTLANGYAKGGDGGFGGGGGGLGAGAAIFADQGRITISGVNITGSTAVGGNGAAGFRSANQSGSYGGGGGGGGLNGNGGDALTYGAGGGGGLYGNGGQAHSYASGGGGGIYGDGGAGDWGGGGGGGGTGNGGDASTSGGDGNVANSLGGTAGTGGGGAGGSSATYDAGGGGGSPLGAANGSNGGWGGGGGGAAGASRTSTQKGNDGDGGRFGGGGGGTFFPKIGISEGGDGGFGAGGGGGGNSASSTEAVPPAAGGDGGFGAGGGGIGSGNLLRTGPGGTGGAFAGEGGGGQRFGGGGGGAALGGGVFVGPGATLTVSDSDSDAGSLAGGSGGTGGHPQYGNATNGGAGQTAGSAFFLSGPTTYHVSDGLTKTIAGSIADASPVLGDPTAAGYQAATLVKSGSGTLVLAAANTYAGGTVLAEGTLRAEVAGALGSTGTITFNGGALQAGADNTTDYSSRFSQAADQHYRIDTNGQDVTLKTPLTSSGGTLTKLGEGTLTITGDNSYTGTTTISEGTLALSAPQFIAPSGAALRLEADSGVTTDNGGRVTGWTDLSGNANHASAGGGNVTLGTLSGGEAALIFGDGSYLNTVLSSAGTAYTLFSVMEAVTVDGSRTLLGSSANGNLQFRIDNGKLELLGQNIVSLGTSDDSVAAETALLVAASVTDGEQVYYIGNTGAGAQNSAYTPAGASTFRIGNNATGSEFFTGAISAFFIYDSVLSPEQMTAVQTYLNWKYFGGDGGDLAYTSSTLPENTAVDITTSGAALDLNGNAQAIGSLKGVSGSKVYLGSGALTVGSDGASTTFAGNISDTGGLHNGTGGSLTKVGAGTLTLSSDNTYTGSTRIEAGTFLVNGSLANTAVSVFSGATLGGNGRIDGLTTIKSGARLAAGNSPGTLTFTAGLTLNDGAILDFELGTASDLIRVTGGTLSSTGTITVNLFDSGGFTAGTYTLIDATGATLTSIGATTFELGTVIAGYDYTFTQAGNLFQLIATSAIPEPAAFAYLAGLGILALAVFQRRKRQTW